MDKDNVLLEVKHLTKEFPGVKALDNITFRIDKGEVHCLLGENGAGKSTLMKCIIGMYKPTSGEVWFDGKRLDNNSVLKSLAAGISMIHQELSPVREKTIMENIWLGREPKNKLGFVDHKKMYQMTEEILNEVEMDIDPKLLMKQLTVAKMQMIEIAKAISYDAKMIIMDEPTSSLTEKEIEQLFKIIRRLKEKNVSVIFISHKLDEIKEICDRITIFRDGQYVVDRDVATTSTQDMINYMVGREIDQLFPKQEAKIGATRLKVRGLSDGKAFHNISFDLREGEILGFAGLVGAGRSEVMEALFGHREIKEGTVEVNGKTMVNKTPSDAIKNGWAFLTEDRRKTGIFPMLSVDYNILSSSMDKYRGPARLLKTKQMKRDATDLIEKLQVKTPSGTTAIQNLSGGNQQKALIAKWLLTNPEILIIDEPTRGIDVGAKSEIHRKISTLAQNGKCVLMVSSELPEVLGMSDRVVVMHEGKITGILENDGLTQEEVLMYASGEKDDFPFIE